MLYFRIDCPYILTALVNMTVDLYENILAVPEKTGRVFIGYVRAVIEANAYSMAEIIKGQPLLAHVSINPDAGIDLRHYWQDNGRNKRLTNSKLSLQEKANVFS